MPDPISWSFVWPYYLAALVFGYVVGSTPFGVIITRLAGTGDLRAIGSGNIGATNVLRTGRRDLAALTLAGDLLKGTFAVWIGGLWGPETAVIAGFGVFIGHLLPFWLKFRGGKGVATYIGILLALHWPAALAFVIIWIAVAAIVRLSSLAALIASLAIPFVLMAFDEWRLVEVVAVYTVVIWLTHWRNIGRLLGGREPKIGHKP
jgi:glycerol-3-phosphate acyltransferase PlsY